MAVSSSCADRRSERVNGSNNLAVHALVAAFAADTAMVDESSARAAVAEVTAD